jgi:hypothetical protein
MAYPQDYENYDSNKGGKITQICYDEEELNKLLYDFADSAAKGDTRKILISDNLFDFLKKRLLYSNSTRVVGWGRENGILSATLELFADIKDRLFMQRRILIQKFLDQIEASEKVNFSDHQREIIIAGILSAFEQGMKVDANSILPTYEELKEKMGLYVNRPHDPDTGKPEGILNFLETGWPAPFIAAGLLTRPDLRRIDPQAEQALKNWVRESKRQPPSHLHIPTKSEAIDRELSDDPDKIRTAWRLARAHDRRKNSSPTQR